MIAFASNATPWNNDSLISPKIQLTSDGAELSFWAKACDARYGSEKFRVYVSTTGTDISSFTPTSTEITTPADAAWHQYAYDLSSYSGQAIYIAIQCTSKDQFGFAIDDFKVISKKIPTPAPNCPTLTKPTDDNTSVHIFPSVTLSWEASKTGGIPTTYDVYLETTSGDLSKLGTTPSTAVNLSNVKYNTTYYWKIVAINNDGSTTDCPEYSFSTQVSPTAPYCGPLNFAFLWGGAVVDGTEAISYVDFAGIQNRTDEDAEETPHEIFLDKVAKVTKGSTHEIKVEGNTGGNYDTKVVVFVDWNQNGVLNDPGEVYEIADLLSNSTGADGVQVKTNITVPADALTGPTRMRVKKIGFSSSDNPAAFLDPCAGASYGQAEGYTVNVGNLAVNDINKAKVQAYPNPVTDLLKITTGTNAKNITVFDITGKKVLTQTATSSNNEVNMSKVAPGAYVVIVETENGAETIKVIKK